MPRGIGLFHFRYKFSIKPKNIFFKSSIDKQIFICYNIKAIKLRDVAQLVARMVWDHDVAGSNPVIPTKTPHLALVGWGVFIWFEGETVVNDSPVDCQSRGKPCPQTRRTLSFRPKLALGSNSQSLFLCFLRLKF